MVTGQPGGASFRANIVRAQTLWELGVEIASDMTTTYGGNRDMVVTVGSGSGDEFKHWLRMATGSPILAHDIVSGGLEMAFVNPSGCLTQAYRGTGMFSAPLPIRVVASYPSWDRFVCVLHERTGLKSIADINEQRYPLKLSIREDPTHSTRVLIEQMLGAHGFSLADIESWGGSFQTNGPPHDQRRMQAITDGTIDAVFDEGIPTGWFEHALANGMQPITLADETFATLGEIGWRKVVIPAGRFKGLTQDYACIDYSGWPLYTRESLDDDIAYKVCAAFQARMDRIPWDPGSYTGIDQIGRDTESTPLDVPLHTGAERWYRENGYI
jgi:hypothetical protein